MGEYVTRAVSQEEYDKIITTLRVGYIHKGIKHRPNDQVAMILVLEANLGCRIGDIITLTRESFVCDNGIWKLNITEEKTKKRRNFIVPQPVKDYIDHYCECRGITEGRIFNIESPAVWKQLRAATAYLGLDNISCHSFRKMAACNLYEASGHDIEAVREFLNHSSTRITQTYIKRSDAQLEKAIEKCVDIV